MSSRILLGNRSTGGYGLYVSEPGNNVVDCAKGKLSFFTDSGETGSNFVTKGIHQTIPWSGGTGTSAPVAINNVSLSTNQSNLSLSHVNLGADTFVYGGLQNTTNPTTSDFQSGISFSNLQGASAVISANGVGATFQVAVFKKLSSSALY